MKSIGHPTSSIKKHGETSKKTKQTGFSALGQHEVMQAKTPKLKPLQNPKHTKNALEEKNIQTRHDEVLKSPPISLKRLSIELHEPFFSPGSVKGGRSFREASSDTIQYSKYLDFFKESIYSLKQYVHASTEHNTKLEMAKTIVREQIKHALHEKKHPISREGYQAFIREKGGLPNPKTLENILSSDLSAEDLSLLFQATKSVFEEYDTLSFEGTNKFLGETLENISRKSIEIGVYGSSNEVIFSEALKNTRYHHAISETIQENISPLSAEQKRYFLGELERSEESFKRLYGQSFLKEIKTNLSQASL